MRTFRLRLSLLAVLPLCGCATIFNGTRQDITFETTPAGAHVSSDGEEVCVTPCTAKLKRSDEHVVTLQLPGHFPYRLILRTKGSNWVAPSIIFGGPLFLVPDLVTGSAWYLVPEAVKVEMDPLPAPVAMPAVVPAVTQVPNG